MGCARDGHSPPYPPSRNGQLNKNHPKQNKITNPKVPKLKINNKTK
jgi:hypothetical protein